MSERWIWIVRYAVVTLLALVLAAALGEMSLFKTTRLGKTGLTAAQILQFFGFGGALLVLWMLAQRAAALMPAEDERWKVVKSILVPLATLIVIAGGHGVLLLVLGPLMSKSWHQAYNWLFIVAIIISAAWLLAVLFTGSASLAPLFGASGPGGAAARQSGGTVLSTVKNVDRA